MNEITPTTFTTRDKAFGVSPALTRHALSICFLFVLLSVMNWATATKNTVKLPERARRSPSHPQNSQVVIGAKKASARKMPASQYCRKLTGVGSNSYVFLFNDTSNGKIDDTLA